MVPDIRETGRCFFEGFTIIRPILLKIGGFKSTLIRGNNCLCEQNVSGRTPFAHDWLAVHSAIIRLYKTFMDFVRIFVLKIDVLSADGISFSASRC